MNFPRYPKYKPSGVEWLGEVPESWEVRRIKHLGKTITGGTPKTEEPEYWTDGDVPWLPSGKVQNGSIHKEDADTFITKRALAESAAKLIKPGSALIALTGATCANAAFLTFESTANQSVVGIEPKSNSNGRFIYYSLLAQREQVLTHKSGGAQGGINQEDVRNLVITAPEKVEQTAIAEFLDRETGKIDELVAEQRRLMEVLKEKRQAVISHAVTKGLNPHAPMKPSGIEWLGDVPEDWEVMSLRRCKKRIQTGGTPPTADQSYYEDGTVPWFGPGSFDENLTLSEPIKWLNESAVKEGVARVFAAGATMIVTIGATLGKVSSLVEDGSCNQQITVIEFDPRRVCARYATYQIKRLEHALRAIAPSATLPILGLGEVADIDMVIPPLADQVAIVAHLDTELAKFDTLSTEAQRAIELLQERRTALISAAVTGQIDVRNPLRN